MKKTRTLEMIILKAIFLVRGEYGPSGNMNKVILSTKYLV